jgi:thiosulfate/3-mercaptopyruvate sulfurtransferase
MVEMESNLVSVEWLEEHLDGRNIIVLFTSMADIASGTPEPLPVGLIPGSIFFDFENFCNKKSPYPHTMPSEEDFQREARKLGINANSHLIVYDSKGLYCAPRVWWMFKAMGHNNIQVLDGGLPAWLNKDFATDKHFLQPKDVGNFQALSKRRSFVSAGAIVKHLSQIKLVDARSEGRFNGTAPEPRPGLRSGHIPLSINLPFTLCLQQGHLKNKTQLATLFTERGINERSYIVASCGSGVTACIIALAASELGYEKLSVYDGSWSEWGANAQLPIVTAD